MLEENTSSWCKETSPSGYPMLIKVTLVESAWQEYYVRPISIEMHGKSCEGVDSAEHVSHHSHSA